MLDVYGWDSDDAPGYGWALHERTKWPEALRSARTELEWRRWALSDLLWSLKPVPMPGLGTLGVDEHLRLYYDEKILPPGKNRWTKTETWGVLYHEAQHVLRDHPSRGRALRATEEAAGRAWSDLRWNAACDLAINGPLLAEGVTLPEGALTPRMYSLDANHTAEEYYSLLVETGSESTGGHTGPCGSFSVLPENDPETAKKLEEAAKAAGVTGLPAAIVEAIRERVAGQIDPNGARPQGGSDPRKPAPAPRQTAGKDYTPGQPGDGIGDSPGSLVRWAEAYHESKLDWRSELRRILGTCLPEKGPVDPNYLRPHRRQGANPRILMPSFTKRTPSVAVIGDTSGSMGGEQLERVKSEVGAIGRAAGADVRFLAYDTRSYGLQKVRRGNAASVEMRGGGGTDMAAALVEACALRPRPDAVILLTDAITGWPSEKLPVPIIVGVVPEYEDHISGYALRIPKDYRAFVIRDHAKHSVEG